VQASNSATVPAQTDAGWQQAAIGQSGNQVIDLSSLNLQGQYLHRMWYLNPSLDTKKWYQASIGACDWGYAPIASGIRHVLTIRDKRRILTIQDLREALTIADKRDITTLK